MSRTRFETIEIGELRTAIGINEEVKVEFDGADYLDSPVDGSTRYGYVSVDVLSIQPRIDLLRELETRGWTLVTETVCGAHPYWILRKH
jgi:hypothetical protein